MITIAQPITTVNATMADKNIVEQADDRFLEMFPIIKRQAQRAFSGYNADKRDEAVQGVSVLALEMTRSLAASGRLHEAYPTTIAKFAVGKYREGRIGVPSSSTDAMAESCRHLGRSTVKHYGLAENIADTFESEATATDGRYPVHRTVGFKIDFFETWLASQTPKNQAIIRDLAMGYTPGEIATKHGISMARVSQLRKQYEKDWNAFIDPKEERDFIDELRELAAKG